MASQMELLTVFPHFPLVYLHKSEIQFNQFVTSVYEDFLQRLYGQLQLFLSETAYARKTTSMNTLQYMTLQLNIYQF